MVQTYCQPHCIAKYMEHTVLFAVALDIGEQRPLAGISENTSVLLNIDCLMIFNL